MIDARHPQTILAWALNGAVLPIANGAPLRLRLERQLGYKHAKYVNAIEAVASLAHIGAGKGGYWEDRVDYRSEEHTSELQSLMRISYAVFCLKKKNHQKHN